MQEIRLALTEFIAIRNARLFGTNKTPKITFNHFQLHIMFLATYRLIQ